MQASRRGLYSRCCKSAPFSIYENIISRGSCCAAFLVRLSSRLNKRTAPSDARGDADEITPKFGDANEMACVCVLPEGVLLSLSLLSHTA